MNAFGENPFFFFVENARPVFPVNAYSDVKKIVELSDVGCDARMPRNGNWHNRNRDYETEARRESRQWCRKESSNYPANRFCGDRCCMHSGQNSRNNEGLHFPRMKNVNNYPCPVSDRRGQENLPYQNYIDTERRRIPTRKEFNINNIESPERRTRTPHWTHDHNYHNYRDINYHHKTPPRQFKDDIRNKYTFEIYDETPYDEFSNFEAFDVSEANDKNSERETLSININDDSIESTQTRNQENILKNYPQLRHSSDLTRSRRDRWEKSTSKDVARQSENYSRYDFNYPEDFDVYNENNNVENVVNNRKLRSRTHSPRDRRKRTHPFSNSNSTNVEDNEKEHDIPTYRENVTTNSLNDSESSLKLNVYKDNISTCRFYEKTRMFVDRAVDKDSLSNVSKTSSTSERHEISSSASKSEINVKNTFFEFIPLNDETDNVRLINSNDLEVRTPPKIFKKDEMNNKQSFVKCKSDPITRDRLYDKDCDSKAKRLKTNQKSVEEACTPPLKNVRNNRNRASPFNVNSYGDSMGFLKESNKRSTYKYHSTLPGAKKIEKPVVNSHGLRLSSNGRGISTDCVGFDEDSEMKDLMSTPGDVSALKDSSQGRNRLVRARVKSNGFTNGGLKTELNSYGKKLVDNVISASDKNKGANVAGRMAESLKRKLEKTKGDEILRGSIQDGGCEKWREKKICAGSLNNSKLPIRVGERFGSRKPSALKNCNDLKRETFCKKEDGECGEVSEKLNLQKDSVRSRTKPRIKSSLRNDAGRNVAENLKPVNNFV